MNIGGVDCGSRQTPAELAPRPWTTIGVSYSGVATAYTFSKVEYDAVYNFKAKSAAIRNGLHALTIGSTVTVAPDSGDDLDAGASGNTSMILMNVISQPISGSALYDIQVYCKRIKAV